MEEGVVEAVRLDKSIKTCRTPGKLASLRLTSEMSGMSTPHCGNEGRCLETSTDLQSPTCKCCAAGRAVSFDPSTRAEVRGG